MSKSENTCIVNVSSGIGNATVQISRFTHNFDSIKFIADKDFSDYMVIIITDAGGRVNIVAEGDNLKKEYNVSEAQTELLWYPQREITCDDGVVIYQIAAYSVGDDKAVWYSKEGRLIVTDSIDTNGLSAELIGSSPNLITQILTSLKKTESDLETAGNNIDNSTRIINGLTEDILNLETDLSRYKASVHEGETFYNPQSNQAQSGRAVAEAIASIVDSAPETLNTLEELAKALGDDPNFATTIMTLLGNKTEKWIFENAISELQEDSVIHKSNQLNPHGVTKEQVGLSDVDNTSDKNKPVSEAVAKELQNKVDKVDGKGLSSNDFTDDYKERVNNTVEETRVVYSVGEIQDEYFEIPTVETTKGLINPTPITEIPETLEPNKAYNFGFVDNLSLSFPTYANDGDVIYITFFAEADEGTLANLVIDTTNTTDIELIPENSTGYEIFAKYNGNASKFGIDNYWIVNYSEFTL